MYMKINNLKNDKMPDATMLLILNELYYFRDMSLEMNGLT